MLLSLDAYREDYFKGANMIGLSPSLLTCTGDPPAGAILAYRTRTRTLGGSPFTFRRYNPENSAGLDRAGASLFGIPQFRLRFCLFCRCSVGYRVLCSNIRRTIYGCNQQASYSH